MNEEFEALKLDYKIFEVQNKKNVAQHIMLSDGGIVQIQPDAIARIESKDIVQIPDLRTFKLISPSLDQLISYGVIKPTKVETPESKDVPESKEILNPSPDSPNTTSNRGVVLPPPVGSGAKGAIVADIPNLKK